jgi:hypothetical protein
MWLDAPEFPAVKETLHSNTYMKGMLIWIFDWKGFILKHWLP